MNNQTYIICTSGAHEKLQMAAMVASVAAASGDAVSVFFSMNAIVYFIEGRTTKAPAEGEFGALLQKKGVPPFKKLFQQASELGDAQLLPCSMALDLMGITKEELDADFGPPTGLTRFLNDAKGGQLLTF